MEAHNQIAARRKRRRRRKNDRAPISAHLLLDDRMKEDVGVLSVDLLQDLFPGYKPADGKKQDSYPIE
jgi:peroxin-6